MSSQIREEKMMKVTANQLREKGACKNQVLTFKKEWPKGVEITLEVLERAIELKLDLDWFACNFLPAPTWEAYKKATDPAEAAYIKATAPAREAYRKARVSALYQTITEYNL